MVTDNIEVIGIVLLLLFSATMFYQGTMILRGHRGYRHVHRDEQEAINTRRRLEKLLKDKTHGDME
jgi:hypothetical protein